MADTFINENLRDRDPLTVMAQTASALQAATQGLSDKELRTPEREGKWSVIEVAWHLADTELVISFRFRKVLAEENPSIAAYDQDAWAARFAYRERDLDDALRRFDQLRAPNVALLRGLSDADWERAGVHSERGEESMERMVRLYAAHDLYHLGQIERIKQAIA